MTRKEELDTMSETDKEAEILKNLADHGCIRLDTRPALGFWGGAVDRLKEAGKVKTEFIDMPEEQYSFIRVTSVDQPN